MPGIIDSAPSCVTSVDGAKPADDSADFILQAAYENCAGIMTFGPGSTYGEGGAGAAGAYYVLTWIGIAVMVIVIWRAPGGNGCGPARVHHDDDRSSPDSTIGPVTTGRSRSDACGRRGPSGGGWSR